MKYFSFFLFLFTPMLFAQEHTLDELQNIAEHELKSASKVMNFRVNPNTLNYDVLHQKLELNVNPAIFNISGTITTTYKANSTMTTIVFDISDYLTVSNVTQNNQSLAFTQSEDQIFITLPSTIPTNTEEIISITYSGTPYSDDDAFITSTHNGSPVLWTLSEPFGAKDWWPCKQDLNDKIDSIDFYITTPSQYVSVANGLEISITTNTNGTKTTHFKHNYPIPAYLVAIAVTNYRIYTQQAGTAPNEFPIVNYIYPEYYNSVTNSLNVTVPIMNLFETLFETYPFSNEKYGHAQFGWGGGMEHTTVSFMGSFGRELISHELAHQWFGNKITCGTWKDIWLNEGFANYAYGLVVENFDGNSSFINWKNSMINSITSSPSGAVYLTETEAQNVDRIFSGRLSYNKGAMVVHMLRYKLGDTNFFQGVRNYLADPNLAYGYATTDDLQYHLESASGMDLDEFFNDWIYKQGYPIYNIQGYSTSSSNARIVVNQTTSHSSVDFFEMPVPIRLYGANGQTHDIVVNNTYNGQAFNVAVPFTITNIAFDVEKNIISRNNSATLDVNSVEFSNKITVHPNPATTQLHIDISAHLEFKKGVIYTTLGQKTLEFDTTELSISDLNSGVYILEIHTNSGTFHKKFIKK
jgi:aminopeptidase N